MRLDQMHFIAVVKRHWLSRKKSLPRTLCLAQSRLFHNKRFVTAGVEVCNTTDTICNFDTLKLVPCA